MTKESRPTVLSVKKEVNELTIANQQLESRVTAQAAYIDQLINKLDKLEDTLSKVSKVADIAHSRASISETRMREISQAATKTEKFFDTNSIKQAEDNARTLVSLYHGNMSMLSAVEMVLHTLWRMGPKERPIPLHDAAIKMVALMGHGNEFFTSKESYTISDWINYLINIEESEYPKMSHEK